MSSCGCPPESSLAYQHPAQIPNIPARDSCMIEPYMPNHFARQFDYDQLYVGNPNTGLRFSSNLFESTRAWYYSVAGGTGAVFSLPHNASNYYMSLNFCMWYSVASKVPSFGLNTCCYKSIKSSYKAKSGSKGSRIRGMSEYIAAKREAGEQEVVAGQEFGTGTAEERPTRKTRQAVAKCT